MSHSSILFRLRRNCRQLFAPIGTLCWFVGPTIRRSLLGYHLYKVAIVRAACFAGMLDALFLCNEALP